jgi:hypothetical protein
MKKTSVFLLAALLLACAFVAFVSPAFAGNPYVATALLTQSVDQNNSAAVAIPKSATKIAVYVPTVETTIVSLLVSGDGGTTYAALRSIPNGTNLVLTSGASGTGGYIMDIPGGVGAYTHVKVYCASVQTSNRSFKLFFW